MSDATEWRERVATTDIVERLRSPEVFIDTGGMISLVAHQAADEIERLREGFLMAMQYDNKCPQTGQPCDASKLCACFLEVKGWCDLSRRNSHDR